MSELVKVIVGTVVAGIILGLLTFALLAGLENVFVSGIANITLSTRGGTLTLPVLLGSGVAWMSMKVLEQRSGLAGSWLIFGISLISGVTGAALAKVLCDAYLTQLPADRSLMLAALAGAAFVGTATYMAYLDE